MTTNQEWTKRHIASIEYHRDYALNEARHARREFRKTGFYEYKRTHRECVIEAWHMRRMARENRKTLEGQA